MHSKWSSLSIIAKYGLISYSFIFVIFNLSYILKDVSSLNSDFRLDKLKSNSDSSITGAVRGLQADDRKTVPTNCQVVFPIETAILKFSLFVCENAIVVSKHQNLFEESVVIDDVISFPELLTSPKNIEVEGESEYGTILKIQTANCYLERCVPNITLYEVSENKQGELESRVIARVKASEYEKSQKLDLRVLSTYPLSFSINFDLGHIGPLNNKFEWADFFEVDRETRLPKLVNSKHKEDFRALLIKYQTLEKEPCADYKNNLSYYSEDMTISSLFAEAEKDADDELCPFNEGYYTETSPLSPKEKESEAFLKAKNSILEIINGVEPENFIVNF